MAERRIQSVLDLAKYKVGDKPFWVVLRHIWEPEPCPSEEDYWMCDVDVHPKIFFRHGWMSHTWPYRMEPPKLHAHDFENVVKLVVHTLAVEQFEIIAVTRCPHTGDFLYENQTSVEWQPEDCLFPDAESAEQERRRIKLLLQTWVKGLPG